MDKLNIIVADKHPVTRIGLEHLLCNDLALNATVTFCDSLEDANSRIRRGRKPVDLLVVGYVFKDVSEISKTIAISTEKFGCGVPVLVFSDQDESIYAPMCLSAGAVGFVHKNAGFPTLLEAIDTVLKGGFFWEGKPVRRLAVRHAMLGQRADPMAQLSQREREICGYLAQRRSSVEISDMLNIHRSTVSTHKNRIFKKLKITTDLQLVELWNSCESNEYSAVSKEVALRTLDANRSHKYFTNAHSHVLCQNDELGGSTSALATPIREKTVKVGS